MDDLTGHLRDKVMWCMLFADYIVLIDKTQYDVNTKFEVWRDALESKGFKISRTQIEYMECKFSNNRSKEEEVVKIDGQEENGVIEDDVAHRISAGWAKWRCTIGILCDCRIPMRLKGKFYRIAMRSILLYGAECWVYKKLYTHRMSVVEIKILKWMSGKTRNDRIQNECIRENLGVAPIGNKMREIRLRWAGHAWRRPSTTPVRSCELVQVEGLKRARGRLKRTWL
ncbi:hypothetical protein AMTRI_Chr08g166810 [Amborella trichopoda]